MVHDPVVEADEQQVQLRKDEVLVVARVADQRAVLIVARQVVIADEQLDPAIVDVRTTRTGTAGRRVLRRTASRGPSAECGN